MRIQKSLANAAVRTDPDPRGQVPDRLLRLVAETTADAIAVMDPQGRVVYSNPAHQRLLGAIDLPLEQRIASSVHPDDRERIQRWLEQTRTSRAAIHDSYRMIRPDGSIRYMELQINIIADGEWAGHIITTSRDLTEQRDTELLLRQSESQLCELRTQFHIGTWDMDLRENKISWSREMREICGVDADFKPTQQALRNMMQPLDPAMKDGVFPQRHIQRDLHRVPFCLFRPDGKIRVIELSWTTSFDAFGQPMRISGVMQDVTERKTSEAQNRLSEEPFRAMIENAREYALFMIDVNGLISSWNLGAQRVTGYAADEIIGCQYSCFFPQEEIARGTPDQHLAITQAEGKYECEGWRLRKSGARFWARAILTPLVDESGCLQGFSKIIQDISERRRAKEDLRSFAERLRSTSRRLVELQETERRVLATELHDQVGQNLTALGINLKLISNGLPADIDPSVLSRIEESMSLLRRTVETMRNLMSDLRPQLLDDYGLLPALRMSAAHFSQRSGIATTVRGDETSTLPHAVSLAMFRICQEALHNTYKHGRAGKVDIQLDDDEDSVHLRIADDGVGFDVPRITVKRPNGCWGLQIMQERAEAVGALLRIESDQNLGTRITITYRV